MKQVRQTLMVALLCVIGPGLCSSVAAEDSALRAERQAKLKTNLNEIVYAVESPKAVIHIFTDLNCGYCRKLHRTLSTLNELGIQVQIMAMPRQGEGSPSYNKFVSIWCSNDPKKQLDQAMDGEAIEPKHCENPVKQHLALGQEWGLIGTPTVVFSDGTLKPGYTSPDKLAKEAIQRSGSSH